MVPCPSVFLNANPLFSLSLRAAVVALEGRWLPRSSRPIRQACGGVSYGMVCHSCGFWLVTKPDSFLGTLHCFWRYRLNIRKNSAPLYCDLVCANCPGRLENGEVPRKNQKEGSNSEKTTRVPELLALMSVRVIAATLETKRVHGLLDFALPDQVKCAGDK